MRINPVPPIVKIPKQLPKKKQDHKKEKPKKEGP